MDKNALLDIERNRPHAYKGEASEHCTFHPKISEKSKALAVHKKKQKEKFENFIITEREEENKVEDTLRVNKKRIISSLPNFYMNHFAQKRQKKKMEAAEQAKANETTARIEIGEKTQEDLKECTFKPKINKKYKCVKSSYAA